MTPMNAGIIIWAQPRPESLSGPASESGRTVRVTLATRAASLSRLLKGEVRPDSEALRAWQAPG